MILSTVEKGVEQNKIIIAIYVVLLLVNTDYLLVWPVIYSDTTTCVSTDLYHYFRSPLTSDKNIFFPIFSGNVDPFRPKTPPSVPLEPFGVT